MLRYSGALPFAEFFGRFSPGKSPPICPSRGAHFGIRPGSPPAQFFHARAEFLCISEKLDNSNSDSGLTMKKLNGKIKA
jgi:hypothetical protein